MVKKILTVLTLCSGAIVFASDLDDLNLDDINAFKQSIAIANKMKDWAADSKSGMSTAKFVGILDQEPNAQAQKPPYDYLPLSNPPWTAGGCLLVVAKDAKNVSYSLRTNLGTWPTLSGSVIYNKANGTRAAGVFEQGVIETLKLRTPSAPGVVASKPVFLADQCTYTVNALLTQSGFEEVNRSVFYNGRYIDAAPFLAAYNKLKKQVQGGTKKDPVENKDDGKQMVRSQSSSKLQRKTSNASPKATKQGDPKAEGSGWSGGCVIQ